MTYKPDIYKNKEFTIGADPEFLIMDNKKFISAPANQCQAGKYGNLGFDGQTGVDNIFELRPRYSLNPLVIVENMREILKHKIVLNPKFSLYNYYAGANVFNRSLGGHIHFGGDFCMKGNIDQTYVSIILDNYLGIFSILLEDTNQGLKRRKKIDGGYGNSGDYRQQPHGFEYRVPSSWLVSPEISLAFCCLAKIVMFEYLNNDYFKFNAYEKELLG